MGDKYGVQTALKNAAKALEGEKALARTSRVHRLSTNEAGFILHGRKTKRRNSGSAGWVRVGQQRLLHQEIDKVAFVAYDSLRMALLGAIEAAGEGAGEVFEVALGGLSLAAKNRARGMQKAHERAGLRAIAATGRRFKQMKSPRSLPYRDGIEDKRYRRYADNKLLNALTSREMFNARPDGIAFGNAKFLDSQAPQWWRLNFGAGERARGRFAPAARAGQIIILGVPTGVFLKATGEPSAGFRLPVGLFIGADGEPVKRRSMVRGHEYVPLFSLGKADRYELIRRASRAGVRVGRSIMTRGIKPMRFLDAGIVELSKGLSEEYSKMIEGWFKEAKRGSKFNARSPLAGSGVSQRRAVRVYKSLSVR